jgi:hypothetical protein
LLSWYLTWHCSESLLFGMQISIFFCWFLLSAQDLSDSRLAKDMLKQAS